LTNLLKKKYGSGDKDVTLLNLYLYTQTSKYVWSEAAWWGSHGA